MARPSGRRTPPRGRRPRELEAQGALKSCAFATLIALAVGACATTAPTVEELRRAAVCELGDRYGRLDVLPRDPEGLALRIVSADLDRTISALRGFRRGEQSGFLAISVEAPRPMLAVVIDDLGLHDGQLAAVRALGQPLTYAVLPGTPHGERYARWLGTLGASVIVHLPMEPTDPRHMTDTLDFVTLAEGPRERRGTVTRALAAVPGAVGVSNHMGSRLSADAGAVTDVLAAIDPTLVVLDSRTTASSRLAELARATHPTATRAVFLDNERRVAAIYDQLLLARAWASEHGSAVAIGHPYPETVAALRAFLADHGDEVHLVALERVSAPPALPVWLRGCPGSPVEAE